MSTSTAVVILAAGAGTRMKSATPKMLHSIGGRTLLSHSLHAAAGVNPEAIVTVVGHCHEQVEAAVDKWATESGQDNKVLKAHQAQQNGTGDAVRCAMEAIADFSGTVVVTNADVPLLTPPTLESLIAAHTAAPAAAVTVLSVNAPNPTGYGRIIRNTDGEVTAIVEEKDADEQQRQVTEVNSGVFAFDADVLRSALGQLDTNNAQGELYLTDVLSIARAEGRIVRGHMASDADELAGVNDRVQLAAAGRELNRRICERHMRAGVTIIDPATTWIDTDVTIAADVTIEPGCQLHGKTSIETGAVVGPDCTLTNVTIAADAQVVRTHGSDAVIGEGANVGPFTYLRPGTVLGDGGKLGAYVETKNAQIGAHSKVPHLTYVGDATIGEHSNIGCSSVFANYDGEKKYHTVIGSHVRTGSDTTFVAPVTVGDGAYSGAGTVITGDVPAGALVVPGARQRVIDDWVLRKRPGTGSAAAAERAQSAGVPVVGADDSTSDSSDSSAT